MNKQKLLERERKLKEISNIRLKKFKEEYHYDLNSLLKLIDHYCCLFEPQVLRKQITVSFRKAMLVTIENRMKRNAIVLDSSVFSEYDYTKREADTEYNFGHRDITRFPNLESIHPSNPNVYYEDRNQAFTYYKVTILQILVNRAWMIKDDEDRLIFNRLKFIYEDN